MAQVKRKTLVLDSAPGLEYLEDPRIVAMLGEGWQIASSEALEDGRGVKIQFLKSVRLRVRDAGSDDEVVWQGRPPFPGTAQEMRNIPPNGYTSSNSGNP